MTSLPNTNPHPVYGYDLDGVLAEYKGNGPILPKRPFVIITGNTAVRWDHVQQKVGSRHPIIMNPGAVGVQGIGEWKAGVVKVMQLAEFYDDNNLICLIVKKENPSCRVFRVVGSNVQEVS